MSAVTNQNRLAKQRYNVIHLFLGGADIRAIWRELNIKTETVNAHIREVLAEAVIYCYRHDIKQPQPEFV